MVISSRIGHSVIRGWNRGFVNSIVRYSTVIPKNLDQVKTHFVDDFNLYRKLDLIDSLSRDNSKLRIGLITNEVRNKIFLETLLVDPFDVKDWYHDLKNRDLSKNNLVRIGKPNELEIQNEVDIYDIPAASINDKLTNRNVEFLEINNYITSDNTQISGADTLMDKNATSTTRNEFDCHFYIFIKSSSFEELPNDDRFINWPILSILNSPGRALSELIVDLQSAKEANELLIESMSHSSEYIDLIMKSNLFNAIEELNLKMQPELLIRQLLSTVVNQLFSQLSHGQGNTKLAAVNYYKSKLRAIENEYEALSNEVSNWEQNSHLELQQSVKTYSDKITNPTFTEIVKILFKIDDLNVIYENMILTNGFLSKSDTQFNYIVGRSNKRGDLVHNSLDDLKKNLLLEQLPVLQNSIHDLILMNFYKIQLPTIAVCTVFHIFYNFDINTMLAILSFGIVIGLNNISKKTLQEFKNFNKWYLETNRVCISENSAILRDLVENKTNTDKKLLKDKLDVIKHLETLC